jgi:cysteine-rich repeat protein
VCLLMVLSAASCSDETGGDGAAGGAGAAGGGGAVVGGSSTGGSATGGSASGGSPLGGSTAGGTPGSETAGRGGSIHGGSGGEVLAGEGGTCMPCGGQSKHGGSGDAGAAGTDDGSGGSAEMGGNGGASGMAGASGGEGAVPIWLGACEPRDLSDDGQTVLASHGVWTKSTGWVRLPDLPGGAVQSTGHVLSGDGQVVFGSSSSALGNEIFRWTAEDGIEGLGQLYDSAEHIPTEIPRAIHSMDTNERGDLLIGAGFPDTCGLFSWTRETGVVPFDDQYHELVAPTSVLLSANGTTLAFSNGGVISPLPVTMLGASVPWKEFPSAISGDGLVVAFASRWNSGRRPFGNGICLLSLGSRCESGLTVLGLDRTGSSAVGSEFIGTGGVHTHFASFFWSAQYGIEFLHEALARRGIFVDILPDAEPMIATDGHHVLAIGNHRDASGARRPECFLANIRDLDPAQIETSPVAGALEPPSPACGNGLVEAGEACDDGNRNDRDGCTARCARPRLSASLGGTCAIRDARDVDCWGSPAMPFAMEPARSWSPLRLPGLGEVIQLSNAPGHSCAVLVDGGVVCWGAGDRGQLGDGASQGSSTPVRVAGISDAIHVSVREESSCAVVGAGNVRCWGANAGDVLALDRAGDSAVPVEVAGLDRVVQVAVLADMCRFVIDPWHCEFPRFGACAVRDDASLWCWGTSPADAGPAGAATPTLLMTGVRQISPGEDHVCLLLETGTANCWGASLLQQGFVTGDDDFYWDSGWTPFVPPLPPDTIALADGRASLCALTSAGLVYCQGPDFSGIRGRGTRDPFNIGIDPGPVLGIADAVNIAVGWDHACAARADGSIRCWGADYAGQLGIGHVVPDLGRPWRVVGW